MKIKLLNTILLLSLFIFLPKLTNAQKIMANGSEGFKDGDDITDKTIDRCKTYYSYFYIDDEGKGSISNISWDFGDGNTSTEKNPFHTFQTNDEKTFKIVASFTQGGSSKSLEATIKISKSPEVNFKASTTEGCDGTEVFFTLESSIELGTVQFILNGQVLSENEKSRPLAARDQPYIATIRGTTTNGCEIVQLQEYITISELIVPSVSPMEVISCATSINQTFKASAIFDETQQSVTTGVSYAWDFGDGNTGQGAEVNHFYDISNGDQYTVTLTATYGGCTQTLNIPVALDVGTNMFSYELPETFCAFYPVTFTPNLPENLHDKDVKWKFGLYTEETSTYPDQITHNFTNSSNFTKNVTVTAYVGNSCSFSQIIAVPPMELSDIFITASRKVFCTEDFYTDLYINNLHGISNYFWRIKGTTEKLFENETNPRFNLNGYGVHTIEFVSNDAGECVVTEIDITSYPISVEIIDVVNSCAPHSLEISYLLEQNNASLNDNSNSRNWIAKGRKTGKTVTSQSKKFAMNNLVADTYDITLTLEFDAGCSVTTTTELKVSQSITANFEVLNGPDFCNGTYIEFKNTSNLGEVDESEVTYLWDYFGSDNWVPSANRTGAQTYDHLEPGVYNVGLKVVQDGCEGQPTYKKVTILKPRAYFDLGVTVLCDPNKIFIKNRSKGADNNSDYVWQITVGLDTAIIITKNINEDIVNHPDFLGLNIDYGDEVQVSLTIENQSSIPSVTPPEYCIHNYTTSITIATKPDPVDIHWDFTLHDNINSYSNPTEICQGTSLYFDPKVTNAGTYYWSFRNVDTNQKIYPDYNSRRQNMTFDEPGNWEIELNVYYYNGCTETTSQGKIKVHAMDFVIESSTNGTCLGEEMIYSVKSGSRIEAPRPTWAWLVNGKEILKGNGKVISDFKFTFDELNIPQNQENEVQLIVYADVTNCEVYSNVVRTLVTKPIINISDDVSKYIDFNFQCDYIETYIVPNISETTVYNPYFAHYKWTHQDPDGVKSEITEDNRSSHIFRFDTFKEGTHTLELEITDSNGCSSSDSFTFDVPALPIGNAAFTPSETELDCPAKVDFIDDADGSPGNSTLRTYYSGGDVSIYKWMWYVEQDGLNINYIELYNGKLEYYFGPGDYEVYLVTEDVQGCIYTSDTVSISVKGVSGSFYINKKAGYAPVTTDMIALPAFVSSEVKEIGYIWASGDGYEGVDSLQTFTYYNDSNWVYTPKLVFESTLDLGNGVEAKCNYDAITDESITVFKKPELEIDDVVACISDISKTVNGYDENFEVANHVEYGKFSYKGTTKYQWSVDGQEIPSASGGTDSLGIFTTGSNGGYFEIDPYNLNGRDYTLEIWIDAVYTDFINSDNNHTDTKVGYSSRTFNVKFVAPPISVTDIVAEVCMLDSVTFDGSKSNFAPYPAGEITKYTWDIFDGDNLIDSYSTSEAISTYKFSQEGTFNISLTVTSDNVCNTHTSSTNILVHPLPAISFDAPSVCIGDETVFTNTSTYSNKSLNNDPSLVKSISWYFDWENDSTNVSSSAVSASFIYPKSGTYKVKLLIESFNGCISELTKDVIVTDYPYLEQNEDFYLCEGSSTTLSVQGGSIFEWSTGETSSSITVTPTEDETEYTVKAWNDIGCFVEEKVTIKKIKLPQPEITTFYACEGDSVLIDGTIVGFEGTLGEYNWTDGTKGATITVNKPGKYTLTNLVTHDISGIECLVSHEYEFIHRPLPPDFAVKDTLFCFEELNQIKIQAPQGNGFVYHWEDTNETTSSVIRYDGGEYTVHIIDTSTEDNCENTTTMNVTRGCPPIFFNPTAFSPNKDGLNDEFLVRSKYVINLKMTIYNNWGEIIFHSDYKDSREAQENGTGWDGTYQGKLVSSGIYTVILEYDSEFFGTHHRDATHLTVVR
ncbi:PKD domain-containing protein [Flammeovirga pacifica]|uniref:PKD domain-containing protein n=1 Tax=Flammeovirga pacifica TaxID=915059 RepID=A0A1S1YZD9_FLAPC|nr:PKD domain-containing protein [Flammeovirga pacifica]OHX66235.1 hypothetical protein NH26_07660 [Flammeovirga pacifica]